MTRQYLAVSFRPGSRPYTYHFDHDGTPAAVGDRMKVVARDDTEPAWLIVTVVAIVNKPAIPMPTKPLAGFADLKTQLKLSLGRME